MSVSVYDFSMENKSYVVVVAHWLQVDYVTLVETVILPVVLRYIHVCADSVQTVFSVQQLSFFISKGCGTGH